VRALLPALLAVTGGAGPGSGLAAAAFLLPLLKQATGLGAAEEAVATGASAETDAWLATIEKPQVGHFQAGCKVLLWLPSGYPSGCPRPSS